jgi:predicted Zn finger-like uncharacterized protein
MATWILVCPNCGTSYEVSKEAVRVKCGVVHCQCTCINCGEEFEGQQEYWRWLGLVEGPSPEDLPGQA